MACCGGCESGSGCEGKDGIVFIEDPFYTLELAGDTEQFQCPDGSLAQKNADGTPFCPEFNFDVTVDLRQREKQCGLFCWIIIAYLVYKAFE